MTLEQLDKMPAWAKKQAEAIVQRAFHESRPTTLDEHRRLFELSLKRPDPDYNEHAN